MDFTLLENFMDSLTSWRIPGNTISVCLDGKEVFNYQSGFADVENKVPMNRCMTSTGHSLKATATALG